MRMLIPEFVRQTRTEFVYFRRVMAHPATPWYAKVLLWSAVAYLFLPIDLIPDAIPVIGHLDDLILIPLLAGLALRLVPPGVRDECRSAMDETAGGAQ